MPDSTESRGDGPMRIIEAAGNTANTETAEARLRRHLEAIFATPCTCGDPDDDTCPACIAEHALYMAGDHAAVQDR